ncbi:MAG: dNTP triphosphohydrolase [Treponema sp.]|nr:dNTP triphosphohydrolase [Treponema sp.]
MRQIFASKATTETSPKWEQAIKRESQLYQHGEQIRSEFERDYTRLLHCQAYRRLKHKTQVFFAPHNDHVCTRMEHVGHVASVSTMIAKYLGLNVDLTQAIAIGHDIGHAPFGHAGEEILNTLMRHSPDAPAPRKFWHERNSLFFADYIETLQDPDYVQKPLNLTYAVRDGLICHCGEIDEQGLKPREHAVKLYDIKQPGQVAPYTWEGCVVKISDKIAFLGRDIEDAREYHILDMGSYRQLREIVASTLGFPSESSNKAISRSGRAVNTTVLINDMVTDLCLQSTPESGLCFSEPYFKFLTALKKFSYANIYKHWRLQEFQRYAEEVLGCIFRVLIKSQDYAENHNLEQYLHYLPKLSTTFCDWIIKYTNYNNEKKSSLRYKTEDVFNIHDSESWEKCIIEFISGMTDQYAIEVFEEIISF